MRVFDFKNEVAFDIQREGKLSKLVFRKQLGSYEVVENMILLAIIKDEVLVNRNGYSCHTMIEEDRFELVDKVKLPGEDTIIEEERTRLSSSQDNF